MSDHEIRVHVIQEKDRTNFTMRYRHPLTGKHVKRSAETANRKAALKRAAQWEAEINEGRYQQPQAALSWAVANEYLREMPKMHRPKRVKGQKFARGRAIVKEEFERMLEACESTRPDDADAWKRYLHGLWLSGLRLEESLALSWDADSGFSIDLGGRHPRFRIARDAQKSGKDQILPATPDFAEWLLQTPPDERHGQVFRLLGLQSGQPITPKRVSRLVTKIGKKAGVVVNREMKWIRERTIEEKTGKPTGPPRLVEREVVKYASAHDLRRSFGTRWAKRVMPATLKLLMRHSSVDTTMRYYVEMDADDVAADLWTQHAVESEPTGGGLGTILGTSGQKPGKTPAMASRRDRRNSL